MLSGYSRDQDDGGDSVSKEFVKAANESFQRHRGTLKKLAATSSTFAARLTALREQAGINKRELAIRSDLEPSFIGRLESGEQGPSWETIKKLADVLNVSTEAFRQ
jgi:ribosome-binding protein aMBF1 (putative translation factor)